jgi:hypothetical protein
MKSNNLCTEEIISWFDARWDGKRVVTAVVIQNLSTPVVWIARRETDLGNLKPRGTRAIGGDGVRNRCKINIDRSIVSPANRLFSARTIVWLLVHLYRNLVSGRYGAYPGGRRRGDIASQIVGSDIRNRVVTERKTHARATCIDSVDPEFLEGGVS